MLPPTVEVESDLALPPPQELLFSRALDVVEDDGCTRREAVMQYRQRRVAGQAVPGVVRRWAVHE